MLYHSVLYHTVQYHTVPYSTVPYRTVLYSTIPYRTVQYHTLPNYAMPCHTLLKEIKPKLPFHTVMIFGEGGVSNPIFHWLSLQIKIPLIIGRFWLTASKWLKKICRFRWILGLIGPYWLHAQPEPFPAVNACTKCVLWRVNSCTEQSWILSATGVNIFNNLDNCCVKQCLNLLDFGNIFVIVKLDYPEIFMVLDC